MPYASWTRTRSTLAAMRRRGWRILATPETLKGSRGKRAPYWPADGAPAPYALDNGAWGVFKRGAEFDDDVFLWAVDRLGEGADWVVLPDVVADREATLERAEQWFPRLEGLRLLLAVQDGMTADDVLPWLSRGVGIFVGGSTEWKLSTIRQWAPLAHQHGQHCHVARVNTCKRIALCKHFGVDSADGKSVVLFPSTMSRLDNSFRQQSLWGS